MPLYRYNKRLAVFYSSLADTLILSREYSDVPLGELAPILSPAWGFDAPPETPTEHSAKVLEALGGIIKKG